MSSGRQTARLCKALASAKRFEVAVISLPLVAKVAIGVAMQKRRSQSGYILMQS